MSGSLEEINLPTTPPPPVKVQPLYFYSVSFQLKASVLSSFVTFFEKSGVQ